MHMHSLAVLLTSFSRSSCGTTQLLQVSASFCFPMVGKEEGEGHSLSAHVITELTTGTAERITCLLPRSTGFSFFSILIHGKKYKRVTALCHPRPVLTK